MVVLRLVLDATTACQLVVKNKCLLFRRLHVDEHCFELDLRADRTVKCTFVLRVSIMMFTIYELHNSLPND